MNRAKSARIATETTTYEQWQGFQPWGVGENVPFLPSERRAIYRDHLKLPASQVKHIRKCLLHCQKVF